MITAPKKNNIPKSMIIPTINRITILPWMVKDLSSASFFKSEMDFLPLFFSHRNVIPIAPLINSKIKELPILFFSQTNKPESQHLS
ncbi:MAG: hypothetical protein U5N85_18120 [Arcicella sp.]|nr:hypothetical protein [Arcicella sp.]